MTHIPLRDHVSLTISHNDQKLIYSTVADEHPEYNNQEWVSGDDYLEAYANNEMWEAQWYPDTPIGYCIMRAHTIEALLKYLAEPQ